MRMPTMSRLDFDALYAEQWHDMVRLAALLVDDRASAEDVVQDAFVAVYRKPPRDPDAGVAYLRSAVLNGARSALRRRATARKYLRGHNADGPRPIAEDALVMAGENEDLIAALRQLTRRQREVIVLRYWSQLSEAEIAEALNVSIGTVKSTASRGLDALEQILGGSR